MPMYLVLANYMTETVFSPFPQNHLRLMAIYEATSPKYAFLKFLREFTADPSLSERFYDEICIAETYGKASIFRLSNALDLRFPNPRLLGE